MAADDVHNEPDYFFHQFYVRKNDLQTLDHTSNDRIHLWDQNLPSFQYFFMGCYC